MTCKYCVGTSLGTHCYHDSDEPCNGTYEEQRECEIIQEEHALLSKDFVIELIRKQISSTNLSDNDPYNIGYRDSLRELIQVIVDIGVK